MQFLIVQFQAGEKGPIAKIVEDNGAFVFPDKKYSHLYPAKIGVEVLVKITKVNFQGTARFCQIVGGPEMVAKLRQKRRACVERICQRRIDAIKAILKKDGVSSRTSTIEVEGFTYVVTASSINYEKRRITGTAYAHGQVHIDGYGLDINGDDLEKRIIIEDVVFYGYLLNELPNREERADEAIRNRHQSQERIRISA